MKAICEESLRSILNAWRSPPDVTLEVFADLPFRTTWHSGCLEDRDLPLARCGDLFDQDSIYTPIILVGSSLNGPFRMLAGYRRLVFLSWGGKIVGTRVYVGVHPDIGGARAVDGGLSLVW